MKRLSTSKIVLCGILSALSTIAFIIEGLFPPLFLPGARIGVSNVFILLTVILLGVKYGYVTLSVKVLLGSLLSGNFFSAVYALPAGLVSLTIEILLFYFTKKISIIAISVAGAVFNTIIQNFIFCLITNTVEYLSYLPYLALVGVLGGVTVGLAVYLIIKILPAKYFMNDNNLEEI